MRNGRTGAYLETESRARRKARAHHHTKTCTHNVQRLISSSCKDFQRVDNLLKMSILRLEHLFWTLPLTFSNSKGEIECSENGLQSLCKVKLLGNEKIWKKSKKLLSKEVENNRRLLLCTACILCAACWSLLCSAVGGDGRRQRISSCFFLQGRKHTFGARSSYPGKKKHSNS